MSDENNTICLTIDWRGDKNDPQKQAEGDKQLMMEIITSALYDAVRRIEGGETGGEICEQCDNDDLFGDWELTMGGGKMVAVPLRHLAFIRGNACAALEECDLNYDNEMNMHHIVSLVDDIAGGYFENEEKEQDDD